MAKKQFLERESAIPTAEVPSLSREESDSGIASSSGRNSPVFGTTQQLPFIILGETSKSFPKFNATGLSMLIKFRAPGEEQEPLSYLKERITALSNYLVVKVPDSDLVGISIRNSENLQDKLVGISLHRPDQFKPDIVWDVLGMVIQGNARFALCDRLEVHLDNARMPNGNGGVKTKSMSLSVLSAIKKIFVVLKAAFLCMAQKLIIAMDRVNGDPKNKSYRNGRCLQKPVEYLLEDSVVDLSNGGGLEDLQQFQAYLSDYKIIVFDGLKPDSHL
jgi:hypothetical protein